MGAAELAEIVGLDLILLEDSVPEHDDDGGLVIFTTKELLSDLRGTIERGFSDLGGRIDSKASTDALAASEARMIIAIGVERHRIDALTEDSTANQIRWAKLGGMAAVIGAVAGWFGATVAPHLFQ